jgi:protein-disulfide isomerase
MSDESLDPRFERDLRAVLAESVQGDAPASLYVAVAAVSRSRPSRRGLGSRRRVFAGLAMAAAVVIAVGAFAVALRPFGEQPPIGGVPSPRPSAAAVFRIEYEVQPVGGTQPTSADLGVIAGILRTRLVLTGVVGAEVTPGIGSTRTGITVDLPASAADDATTERLRMLLGTTGRLDVVPLGDTQAGVGASIDLAAFPPLFSGDQVADAAVGSDQTGLRTIDFTFGPNGKALFAAYTATHIGSYFAIVLDGKVISAPVIQDSIPNGEVQISQAGEGGYPLEAARELVTLAKSGALPFPLTEVSSGPLDPDARASAGPESTGPAAPSAPPAPSTSSAPSAAPSGEAAVIDGASLGEVGAPVQMEVYGDFQCPFCARHVLDVEPALIAKYVLAGQLRITHHDIDLLGGNTDESRITAIGGYCAVQQGSYWDYARAILGNQQGERVGGFGRDRVVAIATAAGLDPAAFNTCLDSAPAAAEVAAITAKATGELQISTVPTIYLNGTPVVGLKSASEWSDLIDAELAKANASVPPAASVSPAP